MKNYIGLILILLLTVLPAQAQVPGTVGGAFFQQEDHCDHLPQVGDNCLGGPIFAGIFEGGKYMVTPGNCTNSVMPVCNGAGDSMTWTFTGTGGSNNDVAAVENIAGAASPSTTLGDANTSNLVIDASIDSSDSAAAFCENMNYGGYDDWFLPSKSELAHIYCKANVGGHNTANPQENPDCVDFGGKLSLLTNFAANNYWASTESTGTTAWGMSFANGNQVATTKTTGSRVRCVRRVAAQSPGGFDFTDQGSVTQASQILSNIVQVTGFGEPLPVYVYGPGAPDVRTCSDAACSGVLQPWTNLPIKIGNGEYLQVRINSGGSSVTVMAVIFVGGLKVDWSVTSVP